MKLVLIIDDEAQYRQTVGELLQQNGWKVLQAEEGDLGIELARRHRPEVVLCDLLMPRCNGFQVCRTLRADPALRHTRIVVTSARDFPSDRHAALAAGADEYLTKPIESGKLLEVLARAERVPATVAPENRSTPLSEGSRTSLRFWGVRGSVPTPGAATVYYGGNTSCVEVRAGGEIIILDAGTGLRPLGQALLAEFDDQPLNLTLLLTHTHWDHIQGLPFFLPVYKPHNHLRILGYEGARLGLQNVLSSQMESPFFPIGLSEVPANVQIEELKELVFEVGPVEVRACFAHHPGICVGYRLFSSRGSIAFFPDNEPYRGRARSNAPADRKPDALEFARSEDEKMADFLLGTDVLIMDAQYDCEEYLEHIGWGHGCLDDVIELALQAQAKRLFLFHHDPVHDDAKISQMVEYAARLVSQRGAALAVEAAREGALIEL